MSTPLPEYTELHLDFETRSEADLPEVGLHNYVTHQSTTALMLAWAVDNEEVQLWEPHLGPMPQDLHSLLLNNKVTKTAHNTSFERGILLNQLGIDIPAEQFQDTQPSARYLSLPGHLDDVGQILGLPHALRKDKRGKELIKLFSLPKTRTKKELKLNPALSAVYFNDWDSHPQEWDEFRRYCMQDVRAEREIARRLGLLRVYPLPPRERKIWLFDQKVNERGMPVDVGFVRNAFALATLNKEEKLENQNKLTGLDNANSRDQLLPWATERGYPLTNLRKQNLELVLKDKEVELTPECRRVLNDRMEASSTSYTKLEAILRNVSKDNRIRNMFVYMGSSRCGRWSGADVQPHNMARPDNVFEDMANMTKARGLVYNADYGTLKIAFKKDEKKLLPGEEPLYSPLIIMKNLIRTVFVAPEGMRFNVCDLNAIETRVGAWVSQCAPLLKVFEENRDPYLDFANKMYGIPYEKLAADIKSKDPVVKFAAKLMRQIAKPGVLGAIYRLGPGGWGKDKNGDRIKTGMWGYAEAMGVDMTLDQAKEVVRIFREAYKEICDMWFTLEDAVKDVLEGERTVRYVGPDNAIKIDKLTIAGRRPLVRIQLPSGRYLHYMDASMQMVKMPWKTKELDQHGEPILDENGKPREVDVYKLGFTYYGQNQKTKQWDLIVSHGGKIFENIVQGIARDVLADKLLEFEELGMEVVGHVHDEGITLTPDDPFAPGVREMEQIMNQPVEWALTLPLGSDGFEDQFYHK